MAAIASVAFDDGIDAKVACAVVHRGTRFVAQPRSCSYTNRVAIAYDPAKRSETLSTRGLDFEDAATVFAGSAFEVEDVRKDYGETRVICFAMLRDRMVVLGYTARGGPSRLQHEESQ